MPFPSRKDMEIVLLEALQKAGGKLALSEVYSIFTKHYSKILSKEDITTLNKSGDNKWKNKIRWIRESLIPKGELISISKGVWGIGPNGTERIGKVDLRLKAISSPDSEVTRKKRKSATGKNLQQSIRSGTKPTLVEPRHNILQERFRAFLKTKYGSKNVIMEENNVDLKVILPTKIIFYEIKKYNTAELCIREGLGQILSYIFLDCHLTNKELVIVGPCEPSAEEVGFIKFISSNLSIHFSYICFTMDGEEKNYS